MPKVVAVNPDENEVVGDRVRLRISRLETASDVKGEAGRLYKRSLRGEVDPGDARHLGTLLTLVLSAIKAAETDKRISALEAKLAAGKTGGGVATFLRPKPVA